MIQVTESAQQAIKAFMQEKQLDSALRVFMQQGGCSGSALRLSLDEANDGDESVQVAGLTYIIDKQLSQITGDVTVDYVDDGMRQGFMLTSAQALPGAGGGCGSGCSCG